jgi:hypothetical protein
MPCASIDRSQRGWWGAPALKSPRHAVLVGRPLPVVQDLEVTRLVRRAWAQPFIDLRRFDGEDAAIVPCRRYILQRLIRDGCA